MKYRQWTLSLAAVCLGAGLTLAAGEPAKSESLQGEVVDLACYLGHGAKGAKHKECALGCIKGGAPMGLLTKDGKVYLLVENHAGGEKDAYDNLKTWAAEQVKVTGLESNQGGLQAIIVDKAQKV